MRRSVWMVAPSASTAGRIAGRRVVVGERAADRAHVAHHRVADAAGELGERRHGALARRRSTATAACVAIAPIVTPSPSACDALQIGDARRGRPARAGLRRGAAASPGSGSGRRRGSACRRRWPRPWRRRGSRRPLVVECVHVGSPGSVRRRVPCAARQTRSGVAGMAMLDDAERVGERVDVGRRRADRAGFAAALHAERVVRARRRRWCASLIVGTSTARGIA